MLRLLARLRQWRSLSGGRPRTGRRRFSDCAIRSRNWHSRHLLSTPSGWSVYGPMHRRVVGICDYDERFGICLVVQMLQYARKDVQNSRPAARPQRGRPAGCVGRPRMPSTRMRSATSSARDSLRMATFMAPKALHRGCRYTRPPPKEPLPEFLRYRDGRRGVQSGPLVQLCGQ